MRVKGVSVKTIVGLVLLGAPMALTDCSRSFVFSGVPSGTAQVSTSQNGTSSGGTSGSTPTLSGPQLAGGSGLPFEGRTYVKFDTSNPCSELGTDGMPLSNSEIFVNSPVQTAVLVRSACASVDQSLNYSDLQFATDTSGQMTYQGTTYTPVTPSIANPSTQVLPNSSGSGGGGSVLPAGWSVQLMGSTVTVDVQKDPIFNVNYVNLQIVSTKADGGFNLFVEPWNSYTQATSSQTWTASIYAELLAGTVGGVVDIGFHCADSAGNYLTEVPGYIQGSLTNTYQRFSVTGHPVTGTAYIGMRFTGGGMPVGTSYTIRVVAPQLEQGPSMTSFIATP